ncbi:MAG: DUF3147 family protein [Acidobacteria bacterium]|nr:DUF3147 family protein [Acidobacteriota bacterium]
MQIKLDPSTLKQTKWYELAIRFALGGAITVLAGLLAKKFGPTVGGLFLAFPAIFPASATLVESHEEEKKQQEGMHGAKRGRDAAALDSAGAAMGSLGLIFFAISVWQFLSKSSAALILPAALVLWFISSCATWLVRENRRLIFGLRRSPQASLKTR